MDDQIQFLQAQLLEYKKFFEETPVAFFRTKISNGEFIMANSYCAHLLGYASIEELLDNCRSVTLYDPEVRKKLIKLMRKQGHVQGFEIKLTLGSGAEIWVDAHMHINCGGSCIEGSLLDITERKKMELELATLRESQLKYISGMNQKLDTVIGNYLSTQHPQPLSGGNSLSSS
jgi:PAS domain S-box-containing protein